MSASRFYLSLALISAVAAGLVFILGQWERTQHFTDFGWFCLGFFMLLTISIYVLGGRTKGSANPNAFIQLVIGITGAKLFLSAILIVLYFKLAQPESKWFLLPFLSLYLIYTIFETIVLMRLSRVNT